MNVNDIMSKNVISLSSNNTVQDLISLVEKNHIHEVFIIDNGKLTGVISAKILTQSSIADPSKTKLKSLVGSHSPKLDPTQEIDEAAAYILKTGLRALPVVDKNKVIGVLSLHDIVNEFSKSKAFRQTKVPVVMSKSITLTDQDDLGKARVVMREHNISRIPITDSGGKLIGDLSVFDMLKSIKTKYKINQYSMVGEMDKMMQFPITTIMNTKPITSDPTATLTDIANLMEKYQTSGVIITEGKIPKGVIVLKDLLGFYVSGLKKEGVYYQIIGIDDEDEFVLDTVDRMIKDTIVKISTGNKITFLFFHVKKHDTGIKSRVKYSVRIKMRTTKDMFS
ncbi:MAG: CBS domain-containing protein, partial [Nanoarchaeota archaeon]|nr:CBS domain-containing protein [Nanoarchaeota archaeon]